MNEEAKNYPTGIETEAQKQLYDEHYRDFVETIEGLLRALFNLQFRVRVNPSNRNKEKMAAIHVVFSWGDDGSDTYALTEISKKEAKHWFTLNVNTSRVKDGDDIRNLLTCELETGRKGH